MKDIGPHRVASVRFSRFTRLNYERFKEVGLDANHPRMGLEGAEFRVFAFPGQAAMDFDESGVAEQSVQRFFVEEESVAVIMKEAVYDDGSRR